MTGEDVVVVVGTADEVGRTGTTGVAVDWVVDMEDVEDVGEGELVTVEVVEVVAVEVDVEVDVDVRGTAGVVLDVVEELDVVEALDVVEELDLEDVEDLEELVGDWVTVG